VRGFVNVTGPIAAGATTLARRLAAAAGWQRTLEIDLERDHPFFAEFYADPPRYTFHSQVTFLTQSAEAHRRLRRDATAWTVYVQDYTTYEHLEIYAHVQRAFGWLSDAEYTVLARLAAVLEATYLAPSVLVYRPLSAGLLRARVRERARPSEQAIPLAYLAAVRDRFEEWAAGWTRCPLIRVAEGDDFLADPAAVLQLSDAIAARLD
jgi:deoxyadenosine/deoxycytidine kinase